MHPLIGSAAAAAQEPPTLAGAPTPLFHPSTHSQVTEGCASVSFFFFFFWSSKKKTFPFGLRCALRVLFYKIPSRQSSLSVPPSYAF